MKVGAPVLLHLHGPSEKYWGVLEALGDAGITVRGINLSSFDDWLTALVHEPEPSIGLVTVFFPMRRVECLFLDERVGAVESYAERLASRLGRSLDEVVSRGNPDDLS